MTNRKYILHSICLILFSILLLSNVVSAEVEINTTLEDNIVILLDYSGSTISFRENIQSNALYSIRNIKHDSNISVVFYGGFIKSTKLYYMDTLENKKILEEFVLNITGKNGDVATDNIDEGFEEARKILLNTTGTKQIVLISDGNIKITNELIDSVKELQKNNITIQLYQVSNTKLSPSIKITAIRDPYKEFSSLINTKVVVLNPDEKIRFLKIKSSTATTSESTEILNSSRSISLNKSMNLPSDGDEYLNEFSNDGETSSVISIIEYDRRDFLSEISQYPSFSEVHFYSYCNQTCVIVPFDIEQKRFFDRQTLEDVFKSRNAIELVKSGNVSESAYTFSIGFDLCEYYGFDVLKEESINLGGEVVSSALPESVKTIKTLKEVGVISKFNPTTFVASVSCTKILNEEGEVFSKIAEGRKYVINLKNGFAYYGIVKDFQNHNTETIQKINEAKNSLLVKAHDFVQSIFKPLTPLIKIANNCWNNGCQGDVSMDKTNIEIFNEKLALINNNYLLLSAQNYEHETELALSRIVDKSEKSDNFINNAKSELNELDSQIPFSVIEMMSNFFMEPEIDYTMARIKQKNAIYFLNAAEENYEIYKFNSAIKNSEYSVAQSKEGIKLVDIEKSKNRDFKNWVNVVGAIVVILMILIIARKSLRQN